LKNVFLILLIFSGYLSMQSQSVIMGVKGGWSERWRDYGDAVLPENANTSINGANISFIIQTKLKRNLAIGIEPGYMKRGAACVPGWYPVFFGDSELHLNQIELPFMVFYTKELFDNKFNVGVNLGYGVSHVQSAHTLQFMNDDVDTVFRQDIDFDDLLIPQINRIDHGIHSGLTIGKGICVFNIFASLEFITVL